ncbi:MAG: iron-containing alcohol dehydrogenase, partial [Steroidobacteraceae bacterium]
MTDSRAALRSGSFTVQAQERIVFGEPADSAARSEAERYSAKRIFVISTRSLDRVADGPLQRIVAALETRCVGTFAAIRAHTPREDVVAAARAARDARADLLVAVGGGVHLDRRRYRHAGTSEAIVRSSPVRPAVRDPRSCSNAAHARGPALFHRYPRSRPRGRVILLAPCEPSDRAAVVAGPAAPRTRSAEHQGRSVQSRSASRRAVRDVAIDPARRVGSLDRRESRDRLCSRRHVRRRARPHVMCNATGRAAMECCGECATPKEGHDADQRAKAIANEHSRTRKWRDSDDCSFLHRSGRDVHATSRHAPRRTSRQGRGNSRP